MSITYQPKKRKRQKTHGFLKRTNSKSGRKIIKQRISYFKERGYGQYLKKWSSN